MDGNSKQLIDEAGGIRFLQLYEMLDDFLTTIDNAERLASHLPKNRSGIQDHAPREMGVILARAVRHFCEDAQLSANRDGLYHRLFLILLDALGEPAEDRMMTTRAALRECRERARDGYLGPTLSWEARD